MRSVQKGRLPQVVAALAGDIVSAFVPGGGIVSKAVEAIYERRAEDARRIFLEELKAGAKPLPEKDPDLDEVVAIVLAYLRCAEEGAARANLRLLARLVAGQARSGELSAGRW